MATKTSIAPKVYTPSVAERLLDLNPETEIWWDSSPLLYGKWKQEMLEEASEADRPLLEAQLTRLFNEDDPASSLVSGVTTNPPLSLQAIEGRPDLWIPWIDKLIDDNPDDDVEGLYWKTYLEVVRRGSDMMMPIWEATDHRRGYLSGQVDPRHTLDEELMFNEALEILDQNPNVMVKCPGTAAGIRVIRRLTAMGIATNCTLAFILPQFVAVMDAVQAGLEEAKANNVDLFRWSSVITQMAARYEDREEFQESAASVGLELSLEERRWAAIAILRKAYKVMKSRNYKGKMLYCSMRRGPVVDGVERMWHVDQIAGGSIVFTCPPSFLKEMWELDKNLEFKLTIEEEIPGDVMKKLLQVPYFAEAYVEEMDHDKFATLAPTIFTTNQFSKATEKTIEFVQGRIAVVRK